MPGLGAQVQTKEQGRAEQREEQREEVGPETGWLCLGCSPGRLRPLLLTWVARAQAGVGCAWVPALFLPHTGWMILGK